MQFITTKYICRTNFRDSRCSAKSSSGIRRVIEWDDALNVEANHRAAAVALAQKLGWKGQWVGGSSDDGFVYVSTDDRGLGFTLA